MKIGMAGSKTMTRDTFNSLMARGVLQGWAQGKQLQYRHRDAHGIWLDHHGENPDFNDGAEWRLKPVPIEVVMVVSSIDRRTVLRVFNGERINEQIEMLMTFRQVLPDELLPDEHSAIRKARIAGTLTFKEGPDD